MRGKKMPQIGRVEINVIEEEQSRWLAFNQKELDFLALPATFRPQAIDADRQAEQASARTRASRCSARSIRTSCTRSSTSAIRWSAASRRRRSRCAARSSWRTTSRRRSASSARTRRSARSCRSRTASSVTIRTGSRSTTTIRSLANKLLDYFDYKKGKDGYRTLPDGKPLVIRLATETTRDRSRVQRAVEEERWMRSASASSSSTASSPIT